jgi:DNA-binding NarL/FixJ family response regulator
MNGMDILQKIRTMDKYKNLPAIILSNMNTQDYIDRAKTLGAKKFIVKAAASLDEIVREVKEVLGIK